MLDKYIGQDKVKGHLKFYLEAAKKRSMYNPIEHLLLCGSPGLGKTSLVEMIAEELGKPLLKLLGPHIKDLSFLKRLSPSHIVFIDEIHGLKPALEEELYEPMDRFKVNNSSINEFTLMGATTREGAISRPLRSRFTIVETLEAYKIEDLKQILLNVKKIDDDAAELIASRSRGVPRIAKNFLKRVSYYGDKITKDIAATALEHMGIDELGLASADRALLKTMRDRYSCGPVSIEALSYAMGEDRETVVATREPWLAQQGLIERTDRGRKLTSKGVKHLLACGE